MRKMIFSILAMAAWKWFTTPKPRRTTPRSAAARTNSNTKRSGARKQA